MRNVIQAPKEHQQNLSPQKYSCHWTLVALPKPEISKRLFPAHFHQARETAIQTSARDMGGGGGACSIVDLEQCSDLAQTLHELKKKAGGLVIWGSDDRPKWSQELQCRWPRELIILEASVSHWLHNQSAPVYWITPNFARCLEGASPPPHVDVIFARSHTPIANSYAIDSQKKLGAWAGIAPSSVCRDHADNQTQKIREQWKDYWGTWAGFSEGILGFDPTLEKVLWTKHSSPHHAKIIAITGIDGAGKSTHVEGVCTHLLSKNQAITRFKLYRQGAFLQLADELSARTAQGAPLASFRSSRIVKLLDTLRVIHHGFSKHKHQADILVMDRYIETHIAAAQSQLGWNIENHPFLHELPVPDLQLWLELDIEEALSRLNARPDRRTADEHDTGLRGYAECFQKLAHRSCDLVLNAQAPLEENRKHIIEAISPLIPTGSGANLYRYPIHDGGCAKVKPCTLSIGGTEGYTLGEETLDLLRSYPVIQDQCTRGDLIEAWIFGVILDLWKERPLKANLPLWPAALRHTMLFSNVEMLDEASRMLEQLGSLTLEQESLHTRDIPILKFLAPSPKAYTRLLFSYKKGLIKEGLRYGWLDGMTDRVDKLSFGDALEGDGKRF